MKIRRYSSVNASTSGASGSSMSGQSQSSQSGTTEIPVNDVTVGKHKVMLYSCQEDVNKLYKVGWGRHDLMDKLIQHTVRTEGNVNEEELELLESAVGKIVRDLKVSLKDAFHQRFGDVFEVNIVESGSVAERTKVGQANEFDFLFELKNKNNKQPFNLRGFEDELGASSKSICIVQMHDEFAADCELLDESGFLSSAAMFKLFRKTIEEHFVRGKITQRGPSINAYFRCDGISSFIKVDMCLALHITEQSIQNCLIKNGSCLQNHEGLDTDYHVICSNAFWKMSVCCAEKAYLRMKLGKQWAYIYRCLKVNKSTPYVCFSNYYNGLTLQCTCNSFSCMP